VRLRRTLPDISDVTASSLEEKAPNARHQLLSPPDPTWHDESNVTDPSLTRRAFAGVAWTADAAFVHHCEAEHLALRQPFNLTFMITVLPTIALAQAREPPFDTGFAALQTLFTGTAAKVVSLIAVWLAETNSRTASGARRRREQGSQVVPLATTFVELVIR
jgi:hypothetical protein